MRPAINGSSFFGCYILCEGRIGTRAARVTEVRIGGHTMATVSWPNHIYYRLGYGVYNIYGLTVVSFARMLFQAFKLEFPVIRPPSNMPA